MADIFDSYTMAQAWDEMFAAPGQPRPPYLSLFATLQPLSGNDLRFRADQPIPAALVRKVVKTRLRENAARARR